MGYVICYIYNCVVLCFTIWSCFAGPKPLYIRNKNPWIIRMCSFFLHEPTTNGTQWVLGYFTRGAVHIRGLLRWIGVVLLSPALSHLPDGIVITYPYWLVNYLGCIYIRPYQTDAVPLFELRRHNRWTIGYCDHLSIVSYNVDMWLISYLCLSTNKYTYSCKSMKRESPGGL